MNNDCVILSTTSTTDDSVPDFRYQNQITKVFSGNGSFLSLFTPLNPQPTASHTICSEIVVVALKYCDETLITTLRGTSFHHLPESVCSFIQVLFKTVVYVLCTFKCIINDERFQGIVPWNCFELFRREQILQRKTKKCYFTVPKTGESLLLWQPLHE